MTNNPFDDLPDFELFDDPENPDQPLGRPQPELGNPEGLSINDYCALLPKRRYSHEAKGKVLYFPRTELVGVPAEMRQGGGYNVTVVVGNKTYPVGGYNLYVSECEIETALELSILPMSLNYRQLRKEPDPNSPFRRGVIQGPQQKEM